MAFTKTIKTDLVRTAILTNINDDLEELYAVVDTKAAADHTHGVGGTVTFSTGTENERLTYTPLADMLWYENPSKSFYFYDYSAAIWYLDDVTLLNNTGLKVLDTNSSDYLTIKPGSNLTGDRVFTLTTGDSDRTLTLSGDPTLGDWFDQDVKTTGSPTFVGVTVGNTGLHILDLDDSNYLAIKAGSDLTSNRTFTLTTGNSDRVLTLSGDPTIADWFDQSVKTTSSPTFAELTLTTDLAITHGGTGSSSASTALVAFGLTATASEVNTACDGITATASEINIACDGITATATEINTACDGITATASEINTACDGILATSTEINRACDGVTATSTEINTVCDGILATSTEVNTVCDGSTAKNSHTHALAVGATDVTATASEVNTACDGSTAKNSHTHILTSGATNVTATASEVNTACDGSTAKNNHIHSDDSIIKAWINLNGIGTIAIRDSFNVSSITDIAEGRHRITWDTNFADTNYVLAGMAKDKSSAARIVGIYYDEAMTAGTVAITTRGDGGGVDDLEIVCIMAIGDQV